MSLFVDIRSSIYWLTVPDCLNTCVGPCDQSRWYPNNVRSCRELLSLVLDVILQNIRERSETFLWKEFKSIITVKYHELVNNNNSKVTTVG